MSVAAHTSQFCCHKLTHSFEKNILSNTTHTIEIHDKYRLKKVVAIRKYCNVSHFFEISVSLNQDKT